MNAYRLEQACNRTSAAGAPQPAATRIEQLDEQIRNSLIMMVDDEPLVTLTLQAHLEEQGYCNFILLDRAELAVDLVRAQRPDVLLLDLKMPGMSGFEILETLRSDPLTRYLSIIVLTSSCDSATKLRALQLGATDFLAKPIDCSELALRLRNTLTVKAYQDRLTVYDSLTELPNRKLFVERVTRALAHGEQRCAILNIAIDRFQQVNDTLGPRAGDELLKLAATRLRSCRDSSAQRPDVAGSFLCRLGGDEFSLLLAGISGADAVAEVARQVRLALQQGFVIDGQELIVSASVGSALYPEDAQEADALMHISVRPLYRMHRDGYQALVGKR